MWNQPHWERIRLPAESELRVSVTLNPYASVPTLLLDALGGWDRGVPEQWRRRIRSTATPSQRGTLRRMSQPGRSRQPDSIIAPIQVSRDTPLATALDSLRSVTPDALLADLDTMYPEALPAQWWPAARNPRAWLNDYLGSASAAAAVVSDNWSAASRLLDREFDRIGNAVVRGRTDLALASLHPRAQFRDGELWLPAIESNSYQVVAKNLVLVPMVSGVYSLAHDLDNPDTAWISYPVPGLATLIGGGRDDSDRLNALLGTPRAELLRAIGKPHTVGELAGDLNWVPSSVTRHCDWLEGAGLAERRRTGRSVLVRRTPRGDELLDLFTH